MINAWSAAKKLGTYAKLSLQKYAGEGDIICIANMYYLIKQSDTEIRKSSSYLSGYEKRGENNI